MKTHNLLKTMLPGVVLSAIAINSYANPAERMLSKLDTDEDGLISMAEFQAGEGGPFSRMDNNSDGAVTLDEIRHNMSERIAEHQQEISERQADRQDRIEAHFTQADEDGDGVVTIDEAKLAAFTHMDQDADGYLSSQEVKNTRLRHHKGMGRHHRRPDDPETL